MDMFCAATYSEARQAAEIADPLVETWLVADDQGGEPVAYFQLRGGEQAEAPPGCAAVELWRFYVRHDWHGRGVAPLMMTHAFARASAMGRDAMWSASGSTTPGRWRSTRGMASSPTATTPSCWAPTTSAICCSTRP